MSKLAYSIQFVLSDKEYAKLLTKLHTNISNKLPTAEKVYQTPSKRQKFIRRHLRLFLKVWAILSVVNQAGRIRTKRPLGIPSTQISASITAISALYRLAYLILTRISNAYGKKLCVPMLSGLVAGTAYSIFPKRAGRASIALYIAAKAAEFVYNHAEDLGYLDLKPKWIGSWALFPFSMAQLFHTFIFNPECCPNTFKRLMMRFSEGYIPTAPVGEIDWPSAEQIIESIANISILHYPKFNSPVLYPSAFTLHPKLDIIKPIVSTAHPAIDTLTSAVTHPNQPSELTAFSNLIGTKFASAGRYVFLIYALTGLLRRRDIKALYPAVGKTIKTTLFLVMSAATCWGGINFSQRVLGDKLLPLYRYRLIGATAGLWALLDMHSRARYIYAARMAVMSWWDVQVKNKRVRSYKHGDVLLFAISLGVVMSILDKSPGSISGAGMRKALYWVNYGEYLDPVDNDNSSAAGTN